MEAKELRIGNFINHNNGFVVGPFTVNSIHISDLERDNDYAKEYEPIPLTEEWLIKFGFKKHHLYSEQYNKDNYSIVFCKDNCIDFWIADCDDCGVAVKIPFVHQLQNLYFALTGEELGLQGT